MRVKKKGQYTDAVDNAHYGPEIRKMLDEAEYCLNCGIKLKYLDKNKSRNRGYCSLQCYYAKPPKVALLEKEYGKPAREVILELLNRLDNVTAVAQLCGMGKSNFYSVLKKYNIRRVVKWV